MADPVLNEKAVCADLDRVSTTQSSPQIKNGAKLVIVDAFDRKVNREPFIDIVTASCNLQCNLSRLEFATYLRECLDKGKLNKELMDETIKSLTAVCEDRRGEVMKQFRPVTEMRLETDPVH